MKNAFLSVIGHSAVALSIALGLVLAIPSTASALSLSDYFSYSYDVQFSKSQVVGSENFTATVTAQATALINFPLSASEAVITGRIVAEHQESGDRRILNSSYTLTVNPFPSHQDETASVSVTVPLQFPAGSAAGTYDIIAELIEAKVKVIFYITVTSYLPSEQTVGTLTYLAPSVVGGGGGGGAIPSSVSTSGLTANNNLMVNSQGIVQNSIRLRSTDIDAYLDIAQNTRLLNAQGNALASLTASAVASPPAPAPGTALVAAIVLEPSGATFTPEITLAMGYGSLREGMTEEGLYIAYWDGLQWRALPSALDIGAKMVSTRISHLTQFGVMGSIPVEPKPSEQTSVDQAPTETVPPPPAATPEPPKFSISTLTITPPESVGTQKVTIAAMVTNTGSKRSRYAVVLKLNGVNKAEKQLILDAGAEYQVSFEITPESLGSYQVDINGLSGSFIVREKAPEATGETSSGKAPPPPPPPRPQNLWLIAGAIAAVALIGGLIVWRAARRRYW